MSAPPHEPDKAPSYEENIDLSKFASEIEKLNHALANIIGCPVDMDLVVTEIKMGKKTVGFKIEPQHLRLLEEETDRIEFKNPESDMVCATLDCEMYILYDPREDRTYQRSFRFHFQPTESNEFKWFRIDYPKHSHLLHCHNFEYKDKNNDHLTYPEGTNLNIHNIDFCTIMYLVALYLKNPDKYPIEHGDFYNEHLLNIRRKYNVNK